MKKRILIILIVVLSLSSILLFTLWQKELHNKSNIERIAQSEASEAYRSFSEYQASGNESDYWAGVSAFHAYQEAYHLLTEDTNKATNSTFCNEVYGSLLCTPERSMAHISDIVDVMGILSENVMDETGYVRMSELRNTIQE